MTNEGTAMNKDGVQRVLVVDDSAFMRSTLVRFLNSDERFDVVGTAANGEEAVQQAIELKPDVITLDIEMPVKNGIEALEEIMQKSPTCVVMVSSLTEEGATATIRALELGAIDFIPKAMEDSARNIFSQSKQLCDKVFAASQGNIQPKSPESAACTPVKDTLPEATQPSSPKVSVQAGSQLRFKKAEAVLIGISTGGPKALQQIIDCFPRACRVPIVIVQHMPPNFTKAMADRLDQSCPLTVVEASDGQTLQANHIYIAPGGVQCRVKKQDSSLVFKVSEDAGESLYKPSVEVMGESMHEAIGGNVLAIMMTGMGTDGVKVFEKLKADGAYVLAQNEATSVVYGMPRAVVEKGLANEVLALDDIPSTLERLLD